MSGFIRRVRGVLKGHEQLSDEVVRGFLRVLEQARKDQVSCKEVFAQLDQYVEKEVGGKDAAQLMPLLKEHLELCSNCCDEYEMLLSIIEKSSA